MSWGSAAIWGAEDQPLITAGVCSVGEAADGSKEPMAAAKSVPVL